MDFAEVVRRRRIVRNFSDEPVPREVIERIAVTAQRAPSAGFSQGQRLVVVTEPERRLAVAEACGERDGSPFGRWVSGAPVQFIPCVSEEVYHRRYQESDKVRPDGSEIEWPVPYWWMDVGCTVMLVLLAAVDEGLAAGFTGPGGGLAPLREAIGMPDEFTPVGVIPVGHPLPDVRSPSLKRGWTPAADFLHWERW
jgi:nitroreductase